MLAAILLRAAPTRVVFDQDRDTFGCKFEETSYSIATDQQISKRD
jgi:hypothetical protein